MFPSFQVSEDFFLMAPASQDGRLEILELRQLFQHLQLHLQPEALRLANQMAWGRGAVVRLEVLDGLAESF